MSWISSLFKGKNTTVPDTSIQEAEARRQAEAETLRQQQLLEQQRQIAAEQRADAERRYQEQQAATAAENERQRKLQEDLVNRQIKQRQDELDRQEAGQRDIEAKRETERRETLAQQAKRAEESRTYATGRQELVDNARGAIDSAYAGFDDDYFNKFAQEFVDYYKPKAVKAYEGERRDTTFAYGDAGNIRSSAAARSFGDLKEQLTENEGKIANSATDEANSFRNDIEAQKSSALNTLFSSGAVGAADLPDGVTDVNGALGGIGSQLGALTQSQTNRAQTIRAPSISGTNLNLSFGTKKPSAYGVGR